MIEYKCDRCKASLEHKGFGTPYDDHGTPVTARLPYWYDTRPLSDTGNGPLSRARSWREMHLCQECADLVRDVLSQTK